MTGIPAKQEFVTLSYGRLQSTLNNVVLEPIDCTYPDFKRVVPEKISGDVAQFNPVYVGEFGKIAKLVSGSREAMRRALFNIMAMARQLSALIGMIVLVF